MENMKETVQRYVNGWNEKTHEAVKAAFVQCCADGITYKDKNTPMLKGIDALVTLVMQSHDIVPGRVFSVLTQPEYFDRSCYYTWGISIPGSGELSGRDYVEYNDENQITAIIGFLPA